MKVTQWINKLSLNQKLAALLFVLGFAALFAGNPYGGAKATIDAQELALIVEKEVDHLSAEDLADWIIQNRADYRLIDLRTEPEFAAYHIPTAECIQLPNLLTSDLQRNEKIILYSEGGIHSAQAWFLLKAQGFKSVYMLFGGLAEWQEKILFPQIPENATPEQLNAFQKMAEVSKFFGGAPQTGSAPAALQPKPSLPTPALPSGAVNPKIQTKKKKEGC